MIIITVKIIINTCFNHNYKNHPNNINLNNNNSNNISNNKINLTHIKKMINFYTNLNPPPLLTNQINSKFNNNKVNITMTMKDIELEYLESVREINYMMIKKKMLPENKEEDGFF
mmetsp:Transcript_7906/g.1091  ORF Transcript_7906/g.1091 Transcript_7906/m.1091 type:complete len:115 (-) Transcript_7906:261-605(-)